MCIYLNSIQACLHKLGLSTFTQAQLKGDLHKPGHISHVNFEFFDLI